MFTTLAGRWLLPGLLVGLTALSGTAAWSQDAAPADKPADKPATPSTHKVAAAPLKVEVSLSGMIESSAMQEVALAPKEWKEWLVVEAVAPGTRVKKGELLIRFETTKIDEALHDIEAGRALANLALEQAQKDLALLEESTPVNLAQAERA
jgi:multidrug efflux pump subunit AcrA (membrane-fusion protein)